MPATQMMSWGSPACFSGADGGASLGLPLLVTAAPFEAEDGEGLPFMCSKPDGCRRSGVVCFCLAIVDELKERL